MRSTNARARRSPRPRPGRETRVAPGAGVFDDDAQPGRAGRRDERHVVVLAVDRMLNGVRTHLPGGKHDVVGRLPVDTRASTATREAPCAARTAPRGGRAWCTRRSTLAPRAGDSRRLQTRNHAAEGRATPPAPRRRASWTSDLTGTAARLHSERLVSDRLSMTLGAPRGCGLARVRGRARRDRHRAPSHRAPDPAHGRGRPVPAARRDGRDRLRLLRRRACARRDRGRLACSFRSP